MKKTKAKAVKFEDVKHKYITFFEENGIELTPENGINIPLDTKVHETGFKNKWSIDIFCLTRNGLISGYFRGSDNEFVLSTGFPDLYLKDCKGMLLSMKFIKEEQLVDLSNFVKS